MAHTKILLLGRLVMAMYPDTTSFYKSTLVQLPHRPSREEKGRDVICGVQFFDDEDATGTSPKRDISVSYVFVPRKG